MRIGLFSDIHFQPKGLDRIVATGDWIVQEFERRLVDRVYSLGDVLNTREDVSVAAQSAATTFFQRLAARWPVEVVLGNHDMNLKHDRRVSSLDALSLHPQIKLHRDMGLTKVADGGTELLHLMIPYHEDQSTVIATLQHFQRNAPAEVLKRVVGFGHLGINGAVQVTRYNTRFTGAVGPDAFACLRRLFTGHFHVHQELAHNVVYLGSPLQFNFGDAGDRRGIVIYDTTTDTYEHVVNPHCDAFHVVKAVDVPAIAAQPEKYKDTFITVVYDNLATDEQHAQVVQALSTAGVLEVRRESVVDQAIREHTVEVGAVASSVVDLIAPFVESVLPNEDAQTRALMTAYGRAVIERVNATHQEVADTGRLFEADLTAITIENFLGVQDQVHLDFASMPDGVWFFEGKVGAGKSTVLEAICWALFGEVIRSDTKADDVINDVTGKDCRVAVKFANGWEFIRFRKTRDGTGTRVLKDGQYQPQFEKGDPRATQAAINDLIGIDYETFTKSIVLGQSLATNFISAGDKTRREILEGMLGLERFDGYLASVREDKKTLVGQAEQQQQVQQIKASELTRIDENLRQLEAQIAAAGEAHQREINKVTQKVHDLREQIDANTKRWAAEQKDDQEKIAQAAAQVAAAEKALADFQVHVAKRLRADEVEKQAREIEQGNLRRLIEGNAQYEADSARLEQQLRELAETAAKAKAELAALPTYNVEAIDARRALIAEKRKQVASLRELAAIEANQKDGAIADALKQKAELERLAALAKSGTTGETCGACRQPLDAHHIGIVMAGVDSKMREIALRGVAHKERAASLLNEAATAAAVIDAEERELPAEREMANVAARAQALRDQITACEKTLSHADEARTHLAGRWFHVAHTLYEDPTGLVNVPMAIEDYQARVAELRRRATAMAEGLAPIDPDHHEALVGDLKKWRDALDSANYGAGQAAQANEQWTNQLNAEMASAQGVLKQLAGQDPGAQLAQAKQRLRNDWKRVEAEITESKTLCAVIEKKQSIVGFWDKAFAAKGGMRAFLLEDSVVALNRVINGFMAALSLQGQTLTFKSDLTVTERYGKRSGGQRKVTDISVLLGMREVVSQRSRFRAGFLFLDEIFDALDREHRRTVQDLLTVLATRVKKVLVITHADFTGVSLTGSLYAELTPSGTRITLKRV